MPWVPASPWLPIGQYRTFPLPILPILKPIKRVSKLAKPPKVKPAQHVEVPSVLSVEAPKL